MAAVLWHCVLLYVVIPARIIAQKLWRLPCGPKDCYEARCYGDKATQPIMNTKTLENSYDQLHIQCNHSYAGGGWTIIQARISLTLGYPTRYLPGAIGPSTDPWGIPLVTSLLQGCLTIYHYCLLSFRNNIVSTGNVFVWCFLRHT